MHKDKSQDQENKYVKSYVHWKTKKLMIASEYGYKAWPIKSATKK